jgi:ADP-heptose:LPS heptosyltransferase/GT2 family glycosyltransferase
VRSPAKDRPAQKVVEKQEAVTAEPPPAKQPVRPAMTRPIMVELNAATEGWPTRSRFDVVLLGQISSAAPVDTFTIHDSSGLELASVQFGHSDHQETETLIGGGIVYQTGFQVFLPMPGGEGVRVADMWVRARSRDGAAFEEGMRLGCMAGQAAILAGPVRGPDEVEIPAPHAIVYLESADITAEGRLQVNGWTMATSAIVAVQVLVDGRRVGTAVQGRERADVAAAYPSFPNARHAGFVFERAADAAMRRAANVRVQVVCLTGASHAATIPLSHADAAASEAAPAFAGSSPKDQGQELPGLEASQRNFRAPQASDRDPSGLVAPHAAKGPVLLHCDHAAVTAEGGLMIQGWAISQAGIACIAIEVNGRPVGEANYGLERADLPAEQDGVPLPIGFDYVGTIPGFTGGTSYDVRVIATNRAGDRADVTIAATSPNPSAFMFELDGPATRDGIMIQPVTGRLVIEGWAMARDGMAGIDVELDGTLLGHAHYGIARPDVGAVFPDWDGAARSGYTFHCPSRALPDGEHVIRLTARSKTGGSHVHAFRITVRKTDDPEEAASIRRRIRWVEQKTTNQVLALLDWRPTFHVVVTGHPAGVTPAAGNDSAWGLTIGSILEQSWPRWRVTIVASGAEDADAAQSAIRRLAHDQMERFAVITPSNTAEWQAPFAAGTGGLQRAERRTGDRRKSDRRNDVPWTGPRGPAQPGIDDAEDRALPGRASEHDTAGGEAALILVLAAGDELGRDALSEFAVASGMHKGADCFYADEFRLPPSTTRPEAFFKPDFSPSLLLSTNYIGRPLMARPALLAAIAITPETLMRDGFHDLALRCTEAAVQTYHVTELLSRTDGGSAVNPEAGVAALRNAMIRRGIGAEVLPGMLPETFRVRQTAVVTGKVSIIVPTCAAQGFVETCFSTLRAQTAYRNFEIVCIDNIPDTEAGYKQFVREHADKVVEMSPPFNWSRFNNAAVAASDGEYLLFLNDDIEIIQPGWLDAMLEAASWSGTGIVGARLLYPNRSVQHAGMFLGDGMGRHAFRHADQHDPGYFGLAQTTREVTAVTGACMLIRREVFELLGRFDESHDVINNDLDFCLRAQRAGWRTIYTPHATLLHHELISRAHLSDDFDATRFTGEWQNRFAAGDPYFNPHLSRYSDDYRVDDEGVRALYPGHPVIDRTMVKAILVVKVDHIGDFITSLPAIRRLKQAFPAARLTALVAPASAAIASVEPAIDSCIPFEFFHARSELGDKDLTQADLDALKARLAPYRFDIAVDLRKHLSTRHLLQCAGARVTAGYDSLEAFPWLDIVLEWESDKALQRKRSHIADDLVNLSVAIDAACRPDRTLFDPLPVPMAVGELPHHVRHLFARPVVAIHPGAGNVMKQWPERHVRALIELLIAQDGVAVLLVGGTDDFAIAASLMERVDRPDVIGSVAGLTALRDMPRLLAACTLFIGCDSGPKHIAAASGVPTIGIHSGIVDPAEWGPMGERAVALYRDMSCAPCFLAKPEHCPRGLACVEMLDPTLVWQMARRLLGRPVKAAILEKRPEEPAVVGTGVAAKQSSKRGQRSPVVGSK